MAYNIYNEIRELEFDNIVSKKDKVRDIKISQLKIEVIDTYKKDEKITTKFQPSNNEDVIIKAHLDEKTLKMEAHLSLIEKIFNEFKIFTNKQSIEEIIIQGAVKTTIQIFYDKGLYDNFPNCEAVLKDFSLLQDVDLI